MSPQLIRIASRLFNRPLLITPQAAAAIVSVLASRTGAKAMLTEDDLAAIHTPDASRFVGRRQGQDGSTRPYSLINGVANISVIGELVNRGAWIGASSGLVSYEGFAAQLDIAERDPEVKSAIIDMETPGGEAVGAFEAAARVRAFAAKKPIVAVVNGMAASAGYAIASGATRIVTTESGISGSIGVVPMHLDRSEQLKKAGIKPTLIFAGAHKVDGNPFGPLPESVSADLKAEVGKFYDMFVATVAAGRAGLSAAQIRDTEARTFIGQDAVDAGLADEIGSFETALADLISGAAARTSLRGPSMTAETPAPPETAAPPAPVAAAPAATHKSFSATEAVEFVEQARALGVEQNAKDLLAKVETGATTVEAARAHLMKDAVAHRNAAAGGLDATSERGPELTAPGALKPAEKIDTAAIYAGRREAVRNAGRGLPR